MAAGFAMSKANIEGPDGTLYPKAVIQVRGTTLTIKQKGHRDPVVFDVTVTASVRIDRSHWLVTTAAGDYSVARDIECGCSGR